MYTGNSNRNIKPKNRAIFDSVSHSESRCLYLNRHIGNVLVAYAYPLKRREQRM